MAQKVLRGGCGGGDKKAFCCLVSLWLEILTCEKEICHQDFVCVGLFEVETLATERSQERAVGDETVFPCPFWYLLEVPGLSLSS